jgi:hypothetical protein
VLVKSLCIRFMHCSPPSYGPGGVFYAVKWCLVAEPRVQIFMDYQNVHLSVAEAFAPPGTRRV